MEIIVDLLPIGIDSNKLKNKTHKELFDKIYFNSLADYGFQIKFISFNLTLYGYPDNICQLNLYHYKYNFRINVYINLVNFLHVKDYCFEKDCLEQYEKFLFKFLENKYLR